MTSFNITAHGTTYAKPEDAPSNLHWFDPKGHRNLWCSVTGGTSGSSSSPRTELREVDADGKALNWTADQGLHAMFGTVRVEVQPSSLKTIVAQIHAHGAPDPFLMLSYWRGEYRVDYRETPSAPTKTLCRIPAKLGDLRQFSFDVQNRKLIVNLSGQVVEVPELSAEWDQYPFYFKAGAYVIDHEGPAEEGSWVIYSRLETTHD